MHFFCKKIWWIKKKVVPLHRVFERGTKNNQKSNNKIKPKMKQFKNYSVTEINRNFRIKVNGVVNGVKRNVLVGVSGLLQILGGSWEKLQKFVNRAFWSMADKCTCKIYGGAAITFYIK